MLLPYPFEKEILLLIFLNLFLSVNLDDQTQKLTFKFVNVPKQPPEVFCKRSVLKNFAILIKLQVFRSAALLKRDSNTVVSCQYWTKFKNTYFEKHLSMIASIFTFNYLRANPTKWSNTLKVCFWPFFAVGA